VSWSLGGRLTRAPTFALTWVPKHLSTPRSLLAQSCTESLIATCGPKVCGNDGLVVPYYPVSLCTSA